MAKLRPAFRKEGSVTAGNASGLNDGAAALVLASDAAVKKQGLAPMAKILGWGHAGVDPEVMGIGPVKAVPIALARAGLKLTDIDVIEANEAFAAQACAVANELKFDPEKLNVNGRSEEHTSELQSLMRISYAVFCLKKNNQQNTTI